MEAPLLLHSNRTLIDGALQDTTVEIIRGKIVAIHNGVFHRDGVDYRDHGDAALLPGVIDCHVHINEPGRTEWEGFETGTAAAAAGGITTLVDMPLNSSPATTTVAALTEKRNAADKTAKINCLYWGGVVPGNAQEIAGLAKAGVSGFKCFLTDSGIDDFQHVSKEDLEIAMPEITKTGLPLLVHAELSSHHQGIEEHLANPTNYLAYLSSRPKSWENDAIKLLIELCRKHGTRVHIVHLSSAESIAVIAAAKEEGLPITVETCPHYLVFNAEDIPDADTRFKCSPPIREKQNNDQLWEALKSGLLDFVVSDHSPAPPEIKELESGNLHSAWGGIAGLQFTFTAFWTVAQKRGFTLPQVSQLMSENVAKFLRLQDRKGRIAIGYDADLMVFDIGTIRNISSDEILFRHPISAYVGLSVTGKVTHTFCNGIEVYTSG